MAVRRWKGRVPPSWLRRWKSVEASSQGAWVNRGEWTMPRKTARPGLCPQSSTVQDMAGRGTPELSIVARKPTIRAAALRVGHT